VFLYVVQDGHHSNGSIAFRFFLSDGYLLDAIGNNFTACANSETALYTLSNLTIDTVPPKALYVNVSEPDGTYYPGQELDVYVVFDRNVVIVGSSPPSLKLFLPYPLAGPELGQYASGNGSKEMRFTSSTSSPQPSMT
jgi:hypothetical protein